MLPTNGGGAAPFWGSVLGQGRKIDEAEREGGRVGAASPWTKATQERQNKRGGKEGKLFLLLIISLLPLSPAPQEERQGCQVSKHQDERGDAPVLGGPGGLLIPSPSGHFPPRSSSHVVSSDPAG